MTSTPSVTPAAPSTPTLSARRQTGILVTMCLALVAVVASVSGLNVALNELAVELDASTSSLLWVVNAYTLTMAALLLPLGELGDRVGRRTILLAGLGVFAVANGLAATADTASMLTLYRVIAGVGAAMIMPATLSTLTSVFSEEERGRAVGIWAGFAGAGGVLGLFSSSVLIDYASWQWLFVLPVGAAIAALGLTLALVPDTRSSESHRIDVVGGLLSALAVGGIVLGVHEGPEVGWTAPITLLGLLGGAAALVGFITWSLRREHPILDVRMFSNRRLAAGSFSLLVLFALIFGVFLVVIQYLQAVLGFSAVRSSAGLLPMAAMMMGLSPVAPSISERIGFSRILALGSVLLTGAFVWLAAAGSDPSYLAVLPALVVLGAGVGLSMSPATTAITDSLPADKQGVASALNDTVREFGSALGVALIGSVLSAGYRNDITTTTDRLPEELAEPVGEGIGQAMAVAGQLGPEGAAIGRAAQDAFLSGWSLAMIVAAVTAAAAGGLTAVLFRTEGATEVDASAPVRHGDVESSSPVAPVAAAVSVGR